MLVDINLDNKNCLVIGGGLVALRKVKKLLNYQTNIKVISKDIHLDIQALDVECLKKSFEYDDLIDQDILFLCTDNDCLHQEIIEYTKNTPILINNSTSKTNMDFAMAASFMIDEVEVAIKSKDGIKASQEYLKYVKERLDSNESND